MARILNVIKLDLAIPEYPMDQRDFRNVVPVEKLKNVARYVKKLMHETSQCNVGSIILYELQMTIATFHWDSQHPHNC